MGKTEKHEKKSKKHKHKSHKRKHKQKKGEKKLRKQRISEPTNASDKDDNGFEIPVELMNSKSHAPITPEEHQRKQSQIRRVTDITTGRIRLIKGDGEILEEIVCRKRHTEINKAATKGDGTFFQEQTMGSGAK